MSIDVLLEMSNKYGYKIDMNKYGSVIEWADKLKEVKVERDREKLLAYFELEKEVENAEVEWLKLHREELVFDVQFEDKGYAFVDVLTITDTEGNDITTFYFHGDGEAEEFIDSIYI